MSDENKPPKPPKKYKKPNYSLHHEPGIAKRMENLKTYQTGIAPINLPKPVTEAITEAMIMHPLRKQHAAKIYEILIDLAENGVKEDTRLRASAYINDRFWGKASQTIDINATITHTVVVLPTINGQITGVLDIMPDNPADDLALMPPDIAEFESIAPDDAHNDSMPQTELDVKDKDNG